MWSFADPLWESVFRWATISALVFGGIGIASAFVSAWVGYEITDAVQRDANQRIANAQARSDEARATAAHASERTAILENENLKLEAQISPRRLKPEQQTQLREIFARFPGRTVRVSSYALDGDAAVFGGQILKAATDAGLQIDDKRMSEGALGAMMFGISVTGTDAALVAELLKDLPAFGLAVTPDEPPATAGMHMGGQGVLFPAKIFVGSKPLTQ